MGKPFTRLDLKVIAICSMFLDHGMKLFAQPIKMLFYHMTNNVMLTEWIYLLLSGFGRVAFLVFGFQIAEGIRYTHDMQAYWKRLGLFALLSEIPYQMMVSWIQTGDVVVRFAFQNVFVTLFFGFGLWFVWADDATRQTKNSKVYCMCLCDYGIFVAYRLWQFGRVIYFFMLYIPKNFL